MSEQLLHTDELLVNMGPQHPSTHGVLRVVIRTDGEMVREGEPHIGYLHRCAEKIGESVTPEQFIPYTDRLDYLAGMNNNLAFCLAVEKLAEIEIPERATLIRVLVAELNRIASHLVAFGCTGLDLGAFTPFLYGFREREYILDIFEKLCGSRLLYNYVRIGGVMRDINDEIVSDILAYCDEQDERWEEYNTLLSFNEIFVRRTANVAVIPAEKAVAWGLSGPSLRGSGVQFDLRKAHPYCGYETYDFDLCYGQGLKGTVGDVWDRYWVRMIEIKESLKIIRQVVERLEAGPVRAKVKKMLKLEPGEAYVRAENPRGELGFYVISDGSTILSRCRVRGPSFCNLSVLNEVARNIPLADLVAFISSVDIVLGEVDR
ncbi:NADH-quinone oxidoreductase subunit D [Candidatus Sumerlaeota bacterium]